MKKIAQFALLAAVLSSVSVAEARNTKLMLSIDEAMNSPEAATVLNPDVKVQFARGGGKIIQAGLVSNRKPMV